jgi:hypothetical protein
MSFRPRSRCTRQQENPQTPPATVRRSLMCFASTGALVTGCPALVTVTCCAGVPLQSLI